MSDFMKHYRQQLIDERLISAKSMIPCSEEEIKAAIQAQNVRRLPSIFVDYLKIMGNGGFNINIHFQCNENCRSLLNNKQVLEEILGEVREYRPEFDFELPEDAFVFFDDGQIVWRYFLTDNEDDNPPIYELHLDHYTVKTIASFTEYLDDVFQSIVRMREQAIKDNRMRKIE